MKALGFTRFGRADEVVQLLELPDPPPPGPGEVEIKVLASPINPADLLKISGHYGAAGGPLPAFCGTEGLGELTRTGEGVAHVRTGDRVLLRLTGVPTWRERMTVPARRLFSLPNGDPLQLAMLAANPATAHLLLTSFVSLSAGEWVIQNAANSAVGRAVIALAQMSDIRTANIVRRHSAVSELEALGADIVLEDGPDLADRLLALIAGERPKLGLDAVAGDATRQLATVLAKGGTIATYGLLSGKPCAIEARDLIFRDIRLKGFWLSPWLENAEDARLRAMYGELARLVAGNRLDAPVEATYRFDQHADALTHAGREHRSGKILFVGAN